MNETYVMENKKSGAETDAECSGDEGSGGSGCESDM